MRQAGFAGGVAQRWNVLCGVDVSRREAIGNGFETKGRETIEGVRASGLEQTFVIELCVDEGDMEASMVKYFG